MNFAQLFRKSVFARFDPKLPFIFARSTPRVSSSRFAASIRGSSAGRQFRLESGATSQAVRQVRRFHQFNGARRWFQAARFQGRQGPSPQTPNLHASRGFAPGNPPLPQVPGRVIESCEGGFIIGIGPIRAHLPQSEIPAGVNFNYYDMLDKKAYYFNLKSISPTISGTGASKPLSSQLTFSVQLQWIRNNQSFTLNTHKNKGFKVI